MSACMNCGVAVSARARRGLCRPCQYAERGFKPASQQRWHVVYGPAYQLRESLKAAGGRWFLEEQRWFFPAGRDQSALRRLGLSFGKAEYSKHPRSDKSERWLRSKQRHTSTVTETLS